MKEGLTWPAFVAIANVIMLSVTCMAPARAQEVPPPVITINPSDPTALPQSPETSVSPATPGTLPGTIAGPDTSISTNPITGQPCLGGGASAINGGLPGAPTTSDQPGQGGLAASGLPPNDSVFGLGTELDNGSNPGAC